MMSGMGSHPEGLTTLLHLMQSGDDRARDDALQMVYGELRKIAARLIAMERPGHTLQPTALVNEAYVRHLRNLRTEIKDRQHFFGLAGRAMRQVLVDHARKVKAKKRGDGADGQRPDEAIQSGSDLAPETLLAIHAGLDELHKLDAVSAQVVDLKYFLGCSWEEIAEIMGMNVPAVRRNWEFARAFLAQRML